MTSIGELARRAGCKVETVRYYEKCGLMRAAPRSTGGHRQYSAADLRRLAFIRRARELGFTLDKVRALLAFIDEPDHTCGEVKVLALAHAREVDRRMADLQRLRLALDRMSTKCSGGQYSIDDCPIIEALFEAAPADHSEPMA